MVLGARLLIQKVNSKLPVLKLHYKIRKTVQIGPEQKVFDSMKKTFHLKKKSFCQVSMFHQINMSLMSKDREKKSKETLRYDPNEQAQFHETNVQDSVLEASEQDPIQEVNEQGSIQKASEQLFSDNICNNNENWDFIRTLRLSAEFLISYIN
ncbi:hypothetical protein GWI33_007930 [Rhynchophorus ferrugineus]|uniref:Uncharacterized protein n=1 Tax=Rhynchophorus ferrugineus TaxID=354439 RepID=A0A834IJ53_RHYFE|nr:hypothetical protein GWI33_007930 [Rhynchophorus ferrugineus]